VATTRASISAAGYPTSPTGSRSDANHLELQIELLVPTFSVFAFA